MRSLVSLAPVSSLSQFRETAAEGSRPDIAVVGKKVVDFYRKKGGPVISPLEKAL